MTMIRIVTMVIALLRSNYGSRRQSPVRASIKLLDLGAARAAPRAGSPPEAR